MATFGNPPVFPDPSEAETVKEAPREANLSTTFKTKKVSQLQFFHSYLYMGRGSVCFEVYFLCTIWTRVVVYKLTVPVLLCSPGF